MNQDRPILSRAALAVIIIATLLVCSAGSVTAVYLYNWLEARNAPPPPVATGAETPLSERGLLITGIVPGGAAAQAGLRRGDILLRVDETTLTVPEDLQQVIGTHEAGDELDLLVLRGDETAVFPITIAATLPRLGLEVLAARSVTPPVATATATLRPTIGRVLADSPAAAAELAVGDVITAVDGNEVADGNDLVNLMQSKEPGDTLTLTLTRGSETLILSVTLATHPDTAISRGYLGIELAP